MTINAGGTATRLERRPAPHVVRRVPAQKTHRDDIEGLRGVSVLLVVAFHAGISAISGGFVGVDVFFVVSGFLITGLLVDEVRRSGTVSLTRFYARRVRRLLPLACLVLVTTIVVFAPLIAPIDRPSLARDVQAAAVWVANWRFAAEATQYMSHTAASPVLHYWSLSVEEQFYVLWPLLILALVRVSRRHLATGLGVLALVSFTASIATTSATGPWAYFGTTTRAWELAAGGLLALVQADLAAMTRRASTLARGLGLAAIALAAVLYDATTTFPGLAAALPVVGAVLVLAAGCRPGAGPGVLGAPALTYIGRISYAWYLWHWPCLVLARRLSTGPVVDEEAALEASQPWLAVVLAVIVSLLLAAATSVIVEQPIRRSTLLLGSPHLSLGMGAGMVAVTLAAPLAWSSEAEAISSPSPPETSQAAAPLPAPTARVATMTPHQARADDTAPRTCFLGFAPTTVRSSCAFGDTSAQTVVVLIGDSHAAQWYPALAAAAKQNAWKLYFWAKSGCGYADVPQWLDNYSRAYSECATWRENVLDAIEALPRVDAVVVGRNYVQFPKLVDADNSPLPAQAAATSWGDGAGRTLTRLRQAAGHVVLLRDTPRPIFDAPGCLSEHAGDASACVFPRKGHVALDADLFAAEREEIAASAVEVIDPSNLVCSTDPCPVVAASGAVIFKDSHHLTATFARELGPALAERLQRYLG